MSGRNGHPERPVVVVLTRAQTRMMVTAAKKSAEAAPNRSERSMWENVNRILWRALSAARAATAAALAEGRP